MSTSAEYRQSAITGIFNPARVVVLGASAQRRASGNEAIRNLLESGFSAEGIEVVHPKAEHVEGLPVRHSIAELDDAPDLALVSLPGSGLLTALHELDALGTRAAIVPTAGLTPDVQAELEQFARESRLAIHGNNCMGILSYGAGVPLWFYAGGLGSLPPGGISLVSQSGSAVFLTRAVEHAGFARIVSTGNEIDLGSTDYLTWLATDPLTEVVALVAESIRDEAAFTAAVGALRDAGKPLVALKVGRTEAGARATLAHTGALVSSTAAIEDYFRSLDVPLVEDYDQLAVTAQVLAQGIRPAGDRVAFLTDSGGEAALAADLAEAAGVLLPALGEKTAARLGELVPGGAANNPFDAGSSPLTSDEMYDEAYLAVANDDNVDSVIVIIEGHGAVSEDAARGVGEMLGTATRRALAAGKPVVAASSSSTATHPLLPEALGVPVVRGIENALVAVRAAARNRAALPVLPARPTGLPSAEAVDRLRIRVESSPSRQLSNALSRELLTAYGIKPVSSFVATTDDEAVVWAETRYPVVAKVSSADIAHRSEVGGVEVGLTDGTALREAFARIRSSVAQHAADALVEGIEIQEHLGDSIEAIVGLTPDATLGSSVVVGVGGVLVELIAEAASARVPVTVERASELVRSTVLSRLLDGYRGANVPTPTEGLLDVVQRLSWLGHDFRNVIAEVDLNPVLVEHGTGRTGIVDVLISRTRVREHEGATL